MQHGRYEELRQELDAGRLLALAREQSGLSDFGDESFLGPMHKLLDSVARDVDFHPQGLEIFKADVMRCLVNRLRMADDLRRHPEILDEDVSDPIIIMGLGRSGTTKMHKLLSAPDNVQKTLFWRMWNPARFPNAVPGQPDPRIAAATFSDLISDDKPGLDAAHHINALEVEEEWMLYFYTFENWAWCQTTPTFSFQDWVMAQPGIGPYRYVKTILQYLQWQDGGKRGRPWVLKAPGHIAYLDSLLECYPHATLVHTHRDPCETIPSWSKFLLSLWAIQSNPLDPAVVGKEILRSWGEAMRRYLDVRDRLQLDGRILDVKYEQIRNDPVPVLKEVYRRAGLDWTPEGEGKMGGWHGDNEQGKHGKHEYSLAEFGFTEATIDSAFEDYISRFIVRHPDT